MKFFFALLLLLGCFSILTRAISVYGVEEGSRWLVKFDHTDPSNILNRVRITNIPNNEVILGMDVRPATGAMYVVTSGSRIYTLNTVTGVASFIERLYGCSLSSANDTYGVDFNPVADLLRVVTGSGANYRINVVNGNCTVDGVIRRVTASSNSSRPIIAGAAYTNNYYRSASTTLYVLDAETSQLAIINTPNSGNYTSPINLNVDVTRISAFDIFTYNASQNWFFAALETEDGSGFYQINPATGNVTFLGEIGNGERVITSLALSLSTTSNTFYALDTNSPANLVSFQTDDALSSIQSYTITGTRNGEILVALDARPANGKLYAIGRLPGANAYIYDITLSIDRCRRTTAVATLVSRTNCTLETGFHFGADFNPVVDRLRVVSDTGDNYRINVDNGDCFVDTPISSTTVTERPPYIAGVGYTNSFAGTNSTVLYAIDYRNDVFGTLNPPNAGIFNFVSNLDLDSDARVGLDVFGRDNIIYASSDYGFLLNIIGGRAYRLSSFGGRTLSSIAAEIGNIYA